jgi:hypothetical protein
MMWVLALSREQFPFGRMSVQSSPPRRFLSQSILSSPHYILNIVSWVRQVPLSRIFFWVFEPCANSGTGRKHSTCYWNPTSSLSVNTVYDRSVIISPFVRLTIENVTVQNEQVPVYPRRLATDNLNLFRYVTASTFYISLLSCSVWCEREKLLATDLSCDFSLR